MSDRGAYGKVSGTMTPDDVVASVCRLADDFKTQRNVSKVDLLCRSGYLESESVSEADIEAYLRLHPELVDVWIRDSQDQRNSTGWWIAEPLDRLLFERRPDDAMRTTYQNFRTERKWTVGNLPETTRRTFDDKCTACAFYVRQRIRDLAELIHRTRPG